jgi:multidrug efflux pump subunit AcrB
MAEEVKQENKPKQNGTVVANQTETPYKVGFAGWFAEKFIQSPLTPLLLIASFVIGMLGMIITPREEDPQISVPMVDIFVSYPGASAEQVKNLVAEPLERLMSEIGGVKHVYSMSRDGSALVTVRFHVGQQMEPSLIKLYDKLSSHMDAIPKGVLPPLVKPKGIDDVPVVTLTLSSKVHDIVTLRKLAMDVQQRVKSLPDTGQSFVVGGSPEQVRVEVDPARLSAYGVTLGQIARAITSANQRTQAGDFVDGNRSFTVFSGEFLHDARQVGDLIITVIDTRPVFLRDLARISQGESETKTIVTHSQREGSRTFGTYEAVTVAVAKKRGSNGVDVAHSVMQEIETLKGSLIPASVQITATRDYGQTADEKVSGLIFKLIIVTVIVTLLMWLTMGRQPAIIVAITIPVVLLMTLAVAYLMGFTINRVSMFALVFAIGILVDDAIVVVENIYRRWLEKKNTDTELTVQAVDEVGNPTILATFTVVAALLPMAFVSDMMGPFMLPIPALASAAMLFSLLAAFIFVPWLSAMIKPDMQQLEKAAKREHAEGKKIAQYYEKLIGPIMADRGLGMLTLFAIIFAMLASVSMFYFGAVAFKMLPFDNKSEINIVIDLPEGTDLFQTANLSNRIGETLNRIPEVNAYQTYVGTASPFNFNGLVRHYFLRSEPWQADIAVQLAPKKDRKRSSHEIAIQMREALQPMSRAANARLTIAEAPPGPPVLASMVAEVYGPTAETRRQTAADLMRIIEETPDTADINTFMVRPYQEAAFEIDRQHAGMHGVSVEDINREVTMAMGGFAVGPVKLVHELEQTIIIMQLPLSVRANPGSLLTLPVRTQTGTFVPLGELGRFVRRNVSPPIFHKDLRPVEYVTAEIVGPLGAPLYGMLNVDARLKDYRAADGVSLHGSYFGKPKNLDVSSFKWDGEWEVTYVTFRDMGLAFAAALVLIYMLVVAEFRNFVLPAVVMAPIPLTLIGIIPGHWMLGADFTATSMIGFIALAGIIVRNSILLVDFAKTKVHEGLSVKDAVVMAAEVRMRPIVITALALVIGSTVLLTDPIFQGMAVSLLFGSIVATFLTLVVIPLGCLSAHKAFCAPDINGNEPSCSPKPITPSVTSSGRPQRLQKAGATGEESLAVGSIPASSPSGRPPRLQKGVAPETNSLASMPALVSGRPARLEKKSVSAEEAPIEPPPAPVVPPEFPAEEANPPLSTRPPRLRKADEATPPTESSDLEDLLAVEPVSKVVPVTVFKAPITEVKITEAVIVEPAIAEMVAPTITPGQTTAPQIVEPPKPIRSKSKPIALKKTSEVEKPAVKIKPPLIHQPQSATKELPKPTAAPVATKAAPPLDPAPFAKRKPRGIRIKTEDSGEE